MANDDENNIYQMVISNPLPHLSDPTVEGVLVLFLYRYAKSHCIHQRWALYSVADSITRDMEYQMFRSYNPVDILHKIIQLRERFSSFRWFINKPKVDYIEGDNIVIVDPDYHNQWIENEEPAAYRNFRENGLELYRDLKFVFVTCKASLLWFEPERNSHVELPILKTDSVNEGFSDPKNDYDWDYEIDNYELMMTDNSAIEVVEDNSGI